FVATETMENLTVRIDVEAGRLLAVKGAEGDEVRTGSLQGDGPSNNIYDVTGSANLFQSRWRDESGHIIACPVRSTFIKYILDQTFAPANYGTFSQLLFFWKGWPNQKRGEISSSHQPGQRFFKHCALHRDWRREPDRSKIGFLEGVFFPDLLRAIVSGI